TSTEFTAAADSMQQQLSALGYPTTRQDIGVDGAVSHNVIADRAGTGADREVVLLTAHLDSVNQRGPGRPAPGADDNASGSAGVLAIARALAGHAGVHDLRLILFGGEEQGLHGSTQYVRSLPPAERARIRAVINMDMIGVRNVPERRVLLEGAAVSADLIEALAGAAARYTGLAVDRSFSPANSDHVPFIEAGLPAVLTIEGSDSSNGNVHSERDTVDTIDWELALEIVRMNVACAAELLGVPAEGWTRS
ncbi:MAG TPA: M28 family metallopeptidase, partial [Pseudonocardia sp.]|nr:M28 family metallopeptidase [Pseudonocardia sp.]